MQKKEVVIKGQETRKYRYEGEFIVSEVLDGYHCIDGKFLEYPKMFDERCMSLQVIPTKDCMGLGDKDGNVPLKKGDKVRIIIEKVGE